jgi:hypothetical protein
MPACAFAQGGGALERGRQHMRRSLRIVALGVCAVTLATAAVLGYVARGDAAGTNICPASVCLTAIVSPHTTSAVPDSGFAAFAAGRFDNNSPSTATHVGLTFVLTDATNAAATVQIDTTKIGTFLDGSPVAATCTTVPAASTNVRNVSSVSCGFPNLAGGGHSAKVQFPFTPVAPTPLEPGSTVKATLQASYGEGNGGANDTQTANDALTIAGTTAAGKCTAGGSQLASVSNSSLTASIGVPNYPAADTTDQNLPCTAVGIGVSDTKITVGGVAGYVASLELPKVATFATVVHDVTPLPANTTVKKLVIWESLEPTGTTNFGFIVPPCNAEGYPPAPPAPPAVPTSTDTCVSDRLSLPKGGGRFVMHALGAKIDPRYTP